MKFEKCNTTFGYFSCLKGETTLKFDGPTCIDWSTCKLDVDSFSTGDSVKPAGFKLDVVGRDVFAG